MGSTLHMDTDVVRAVGQHLKSESQTYISQFQSVYSQVGGMDWMGPGRDQFTSEMEECLRSSNQLAEQLDQLGERLNREVGDWEQAAQNFPNASSQPSIHPGFMIIPPFFPIFFGGHKPSTGQLIDQLNDRWAKKSKDERIQYLQEQYNRLAEKYGLKPVQLVTEDLPDKSFLGFTYYDSKGEFRGDQLVIDIDNLNNDKGMDVLQTLIHETRHQAQFKMIELYRSEGDKATFPAGITLDQVKAWDKNINDGYITPDNDYEGYRKQAIEVDSRDFAEKYANELATQEYLPDGVMRA